MRDLQWVLGLATCGLAACGSSHDGNPGGLPDAAPVIDAAIDAPPICPKTLLVGGMDVAAQGWTVIMAPPATITYGADYTQLTTSTSGSGGQLLLTRPNTFTASEPFKLQVVLQVVSISPHLNDPLDAAVAIMGSLEGQFGTTADRSEMVSIETTKITWADGTATATVNAIDSAFHTYELAVDASRKATLSRDGAVLFDRTGYTTNGTIAVGDQTNDTNFDATTQIRSVTQLCAD